LAKKKVYQTLEDRQTDLDKIESNGPYACRWENSWLGDGYYFWDTFIENAHWWGTEGRKYRNGYIICQAECDFNDTECLYLHGNMEHLKMFKDTYEFFKNRGFVDKQTTVKMFLEFLKKENESFKKFTAIRVNGMKSKRFDSPYSLNLFFENKKDQYFESIPAVQICFFTKTSLNLKNYKIVYPDEYNSDYVV
jgi:hypothetical protein